MPAVPGGPAGQATIAADRPTRGTPRAGDTSIADRGNLGVIWRHASTSVRYTVLTPRSGPDHGGRWPLGGSRWQLLKPRMARW